MWMMFGPDRGGEQRLWQSSNIQIVLKDGGHRFDLAFIRFIPDE